MTCIEIFISFACLFDSSIFKMSQAPYKILVPVDFGEQSLIAFEQAFNLARFYNAQLVALHVIDDNAPVSNLFKSEGTIYREKLKAKARLTELIKNIEFKRAMMMEEELNMKPMVMTGRSGEAILKAAEEIDPLYIFIGKRGDSGNSMKFTGSNTLHVIKRAKCPVISIQGKSHKEGCDNICLPLDLTKETKDKTAKAIELAKFFNAGIRIFSLAKTKENEEYLRFQMEEVKLLIQEAGIKCTAELEFDAHSNIADAVVKYAKNNDIDLILIMTRQENNLKEYFLGSAAQSIISKSETPVMSIIPYTKTLKKQKE